METRVGIQNCKWGCQERTGINKWYYDWKIRCAKLKVGDKVLLKHIAFKRKLNIQYRCENTIYEVVKHPIGNKPVFKVESMEGYGKTKVVHQNLLLSLLSDPSDHTNMSDIHGLSNYMHGVMAAGSVASHVQDMSVYSKAPAADILQ